MSGKVERELDQRVATAENAGEHGAVEVAFAILPKKLTPERKAKLQAPRRKHRRRTNDWLRDAWAEIDAQSILD